MADKPKIVVFVSGGLVQSVMADRPVDIIVLDSDNLRAEGKSWEEIALIGNETSADCEPIKF